MNVRGVWQVGQISGKTFYEVVPVKSSFAGRKGLVRMEVCAEISSVSFLATSGFTGEVSGSLMEPRTTFYRCRSGPTSFQGATRGGDGWVVHGTRPEGGCRRWAASIPAVDPRGPGQNHGGGMVEHMRGVSPNPEG
jgi:hypothetical protein